MYLAPWQIFAGGCLCGIVIAGIVLIIAFVSIVIKSGVTIEKEEKRNE